MLLHGFPAVGGFANVGTQKGSEHRHTTIPDTFRSNRVAFSLVVRTNVGTTQACNRREQHGLSSSHYHFDLCLQNHVLTSLFVGLVRPWSSLRQRSEYVRGFMRAAVQIQHVYSFPSHTRAIPSPNMSTCLSNFYSILCRGVALGKPMVYGHPGLRRGTAGNQTHTAHRHSMRLPVP